MSLLSHNTNVQSISIAEADKTAWIPLHLDRTPFSAAVYVTLSAGATLTYTVEYTPIPNPNATPVADENVFVVETLEDIVDTKGNDALAHASTGVRLNVTSYTDGTATLIVIQAGR